MDRDSIRAFASRPWAELEESKRSYWVDRLRRLGPEEALRVADELRALVQLEAGDWASAGRDEDLANHVRLSALLRRAGERQRR